MWDNCGRCGTWYMGYMGLWSRFTKSTEHPSRDHRVVRSSTPAKPRTWADPTSRSTSRFRNLHHNAIGASESRIGGLLFGFSQGPAKQLEGCSWGPLAQVLPKQQRRDLQLSLNFVSLVWSWMLGSSMAYSLSMYVRTYVRTYVFMYSCTDR